MAIQLMFWIAQTNEAMRDYPDDVQLSPVTDSGPETAIVTIGELRAALSVIGAAHAAIFAPRAGREALALLDALQALETSAGGEALRKMLGITPEEFKSTEE